MNITFGICVGDDQQYLEKLISSIESQPWEKYQQQYQIILVFNKGAKLLDREWKSLAECYFVDGWLPKKKNLIGSLAVFESVVLLHDYYLIPDNWLESLIFVDMAYVGNWSLLQSRVINANGSRGADWLINPNVMEKTITKSPEFEALLREAAPQENHPKYVCGLPYIEHRLTKYQYVSGGYIMCKRDVLRRVPLDETLKPGDAEDVDWSERLIDLGYRPTLSLGTSVKIQKPNKWEVTQIPEKALEIFRKLNDD